MNAVPLLVTLMLVLSLFGAPGTLGNGPTPAPTDFSTTLIQPVPGGVALCYYDTDGDGTLNVGDALYLDPRSDVCGQVVGSGVVRLTTYDDHVPFTNVHLLDSDFGLSYAHCCAATPGLSDDGRELDFYDADGNGVFNLGDTMYADADANDLVTAGDLRWVPYGPMEAGTLVASGDPDVNLALHTTGGGSDPLDTSFAFAEDDGNAVFGFGDAPYLDLSQGGALVPVAVNDIRLGGPGGGQVVTATSSDVTPLLLPMRAAGVALCFHSTDGDSVYDHGEPLYLDIDSDVCGPAVEANDLRLSGSGTSAAFSTVRTIDSDFNIALHGFAGAGTTSAGIADGTSEIDFYDADGNGFLNTGDTIYADLNGDNAVGVGDYRWTPFGSLGAGIIVEAGDADVTLTLATTAANAGSHALDTALSFWDLNGDAWFNSGDVAYLDLGQVGSDAVVEVNDVRLGEVGTRLPGRIVQELDGDAAATLQPVHAAGVSICFHSTDGDPQYDAGEPLYLNKNVDAGPCGSVQANDIRLNGLGNLLPFSKVQTPDADFGIPLTASQGAGTSSPGIADATSELDFYDADGNGFYNQGDTMYADIDGDNMVGVGDFRWRPFASFAAGTVVAAGDPDTNLVLSNVAANTGSFALDASLAYWDLNGDHSFNGGDVAFLQLAGLGAGAYLAPNDIRLDPDQGAVDQDENDQDGDGFSEPEDCNDHDANVYPGRPELENGIDDDCDGLVDEGLGGPVDQDGDGYVPPSDCDDLDANVHPNNNELDNGIDDDCDGLIDEGLDLDGDGHTPVAGGDCDDSDVTVHPGQNEVDNGHDDDCDGLVDDGYDLDGDGYTPIFGSDCDDSVAAVHPGQNEVDNGIDDDCEGGVDEGYDLDGDGYTPIFGGDCNDTDSLIHPNNNELDNGIDDDCDGSVDEGLDLDGDSYTPIFGRDCDDGDALVHPGADERDNLLDDDCDGTIDEGIDSDHDGLDYPAEQDAGTDYLNPDTDGDGLIDGQEIHTWGTDPLEPDTDGDHFGDGNEVQCGSDPNDPMDFLPVGCLVPEIPGTDG